ncbi:MAG: AAA family ATPase, partial [Sphingomonadales bacterium]|nr:AAA family ATPase [Sphingomonadales bacterium]
INGTSGAGKTTTCAAFARHAAEPYLMFGMDLLAGTLLPARYTMFGSMKEQGYQPTAYGPVCMQALSAMHAMIAAASRTGQNVVVDHLMFLDPPVLQDAVWRMADVPVLFVNLKPSRAVLEKRVTTREIHFIPPPIQEAMDAAGPDIVAAFAKQLGAVTPWFYEHAYANEIYDLELDSSAMTPEEVCERIAARLREGPGAAFETLRERHPKPFA